MSKTKTLFVAAVFVAGALAGAALSPLLAQQENSAPEAPTCYVGNSSLATCTGGWTYYVGNSGGLDANVWIVRINGDTGETSYKDGKKFVTLAEPR